MSTQKYNVYVLVKKDGALQEIEYPVTAVNPIEAEKRGNERAENEGYDVENSTVELA